LITALALTAEGERLRAAFWRSVVEDPGTLAPLADADLQAPAGLLGVLGVSDQAEASSPSPSSSPGSSARD
jgi:hypothetical protein